MASGVATPQPIRVIIIDDHPIVREGIAALLAREPDLACVGEGASGEEAVDLFRSLSPDVTLIDLQMPTMSGIDAIAAIRAINSNARIIVLTTYPGHAQVMRAIRAGASGYLLKNSVRKELLDAVRSVHAGRTVLGADIAHEVALHALDEPLSERELAVLRLVADGHGNKAIASRLALSVDTIKAHLKTSFAKLGVDDRTHAITVATRRGYLDP
jgi:DNA-binding NarL/FixJ family response regulator